MYNIIDIYESDFREKPCIGVRLERYTEYNVYEDYSSWNISDDIQGERYTNKKLKDTDSGYDSFNLFLPDKEEKLLERTIKALKHYQTFYPKPEKKKETF